MGTNLIITTRGRFAVTAMAELCLGNETTPISLSLIARKNKISVSYLEQIISSLRKVGLVKSRRGNKGGYMLAKPPEKILVSEIIQAAEFCTTEKMSRLKNSSYPADNPSGRLCSDIEDLLGRCLSKVTLEDVMTNGTTKNPYITKVFETLS